MKKTVKIIAVLLLIPTMVMVTMPVFAGASDLITDVTKDVTIDKDNAAWRKAMKEENMPWAQVQAPKAGKDVMKQYQFSGIPYILVLDKEGKIVAKNLRGKALTDKLEELLSGKKKSVAMPAMGM